jgi:hypothetical protein
MDIFTRTHEVHIELGDVNLDPNIEIGDIGALWNVAVGTVNLTLEDTVPVMNRIQVVVNGVQMYAEY